MQISAQPSTSPILLAILVAKGRIHDHAYQQWKTKQDQAQTWDEAIAEPHASEVERLYAAYTAARDAHMTARVCEPLLLPAQTLTRPASPVKDVMPTPSRRSTGTVRYFNVGQGYGYIMDADGNSVRFTRERLAHAAMPIKKGDKVTFLTQFQGVNQGTPQAIDVRVDGWIAPARQRYEPTQAENQAVAALKAQDAANRERRKTDRERRKAGNAEFAARLRVAGE